MEIDELDVEQIAERPKSLWQQSTSMPRWLLLILANLFIILVTATFVVIFVFIKTNVGHGQSCLSDDQCNTFAGLTCTAGRCLCGSTEFWAGERCEAQRTFNRSCTSNDQCNALAKLMCLNVTVGSWNDSMCSCSEFR